MVDGELALSSTADMTVAGGQTIHMSRLFILAAGTYTAKFCADDACTVWLGSEGASVSRIGHTAMYQPDASSVNFFVQSGVWRINAIVRNSNAVFQSPAFFAMSLWKDGQLVYASSAAGWKWSTAPIPDADLPSPGDERRLLPVFPIMPNWAQGVLERITFNTEIFTSETGDETRRSRLRNPRRSMEASFMRANTGRMRLDNFAAGVGKGKFLCPIWYEDHRLRNGLGTAQQIVQFDAETLKYREFHAGDLCMLNNGDPDIYEIVEIESVDHNTDRVTLKASPSINWPAGSRFMPLRVARLMELPQQQMVTDRVGMVNLRADFTETEKNFGASWGYCAPLWSIKADRAQRINVAHQRQTFENDVETTEVVMVDPGDRSREVVSLNFKLFGRARLAAYRAFISIAKGRLARFWMPSQLHDIEPLSGIGGITFDAQPSGYADYMTKPHDSRVMIGIHFNDGRPTLYRRIVNIEPVGEETAPYRPLAERFTLDSALPPSSRAEIERVAFVLPVRFDQDSFELRHHVSNGKVVSGAAVMMSTDSTGMPDLNCWVTSTVYPLLAVDEIGTSLTVAEVSSGPWIAEGLATSVAFFAAESSFPLKVVEEGPEGVGFGLGFDSAEIQTITINIIEHDVEPEGVSPALTFTSAELDTILISSNVAPEGINVGCSFIEGSIA